MLSIDRRSPAATVVRAKRTGNSSSFGQFGRSEPGKTGLPYTAPAGRKRKRVLGIRYAHKHICADPTAERERRIAAYSAQMGRYGLQVRRLEFSQGITARPVLCIETGERYARASDAARAIKTSPDNVRQAIRSGGWTRGRGQKMHFVYVTGAPAAKVPNGRARAVRCVTIGEQFESI